MPDLAALWALIANGGGALALALFLVAAFLRGWIVPGYIYEASVKDRNRLLDGLNTITTAVDRLTDEIRSDRRR